MKKRLTALLLTFCMLFMLVPTVSADFQGSRTLKVGETLTLSKDYRFDHEWYSSDPNVAKITSSDGDSATIKALKVGYALVSARFYNYVDTWMIEVVESSSSGGSGSGSNTPSSTSSLSFVIVGGTWDESFARQCSGELSADKKTITFTLDYNRSVEGYVYECANGGSKTVETFMNGWSRNYTVDDGYTTPGTWSVDNGGTVHEGILTNRGDADAQMEAVSDWAHGYDDHNAHSEKNGFAANTIYTFTLTPITYTVVWKSNDGSYTYETDDEARYGDMPSYDGDEPTKDTDVQYSYEFIGWATTANAEEALDVLPVVTEDTTYYAVFEKTPVEYTVTFDANGGSWADDAVTKDVEVEYGNTVSAYNPYPSKDDDATFEGWYTGTVDEETGKVTLGDAFDFDTVITEDITLYAQWSVEPAAVKIPYDIKYYFEQKDGTYEEDADLTERAFAVSGTEVTAPQLETIPDGYAYDEIETGEKYTDTVAAPTPVYGDDGAVAGVALTTVARYYSIDNWNSEKDVEEGGDDVPDKYQAKLVYMSAGNGTVSPELDIVDLMDDGEYAESATVAAESTATPATDYKFAAWDSDVDDLDLSAEGEALSKSFTAEGGETYTFTASFEKDVAGLVVKHTADDSAALGVADKSADVTIGQSYTVAVSDQDATATVVSPFTINVGEGDDAVKYVYDPIQTTDTLTGTMGADGAVVELIYSIDANDDDIPDRYQVELTFKVVNGAWNDNTTADVPKVVTLVDENGDWAVDGTYTVTAEDVPAVGEKPSTGFKVGAWDKVPVGQVIRADSDTTYIYTYVRTITPIDPESLAAGYFTEYYLEKNGEYVLEEKVYAVDKIGAEVDAVEKTYEGYTIDKTVADTKLSGEVYMPTAEGDVLNILTLKVYYSVDVIGEGKDKETEQSDGIPDKYQVVVKYTSEQGGEIVGIEKEVITIKNADGSYAAQGDVKASGSEVERDSSKYRFRGWYADSDKCVLENEDDYELDEFWIEEAVGGEIYKLTAEFSRKSSGSSSGKKPALNTEEHFQYIMGYPDGTVGPLDQITRAEVASIFYRLLDDETREYYFTTENEFPDMNESMWYNKAVSTLANAGIITGCSDGLFHGGRTITRAELATIIAKFDEDIYVGHDFFTDIAGHWARPYINVAAENGWIVGDGNALFRPYDAITRAEVMTMINAVLQRGVDEDGLCEGWKKWPDNTPGAWYYYQVIEATNYHTYVRGDDRAEEWVEILPDKVWNE